jgi:tRNA threonylcarbamoyladenosine biosynthesis protein TsaB
VFLALETSTLTLSIALFEREGDHVSLVEQVEEGPPRKVSELLPKAVFDLLGRHALALESLQGIAFGIGPGSFTGLRIGLSTVKALAYAAQLPVGTASSLAAMALSGEAEVPLFVCEVARQGELYVGHYRRSGSRVTLEAPEDAMTPSQLAELLATLPNALAVGPGIAVQREALLAAGVSPERLRPEPHHPSAFAVARLAVVPEQFDQQALFALEPHYVRASEPERNPKFPPLPGPPAQSRIRED